MALTKLQKDRIAYHLDLGKPGSYLEIYKNVTINTITTERELMVIGNLDTTLADQIYSYMGINLCTINSSLGKCERALDKLDPTTIDDSLLVKGAGKVVLRSDELKARKKLYKQTINELAQALSMSSGNERASLSL
jgi:hypothetical protein